MVRGRISHQCGPGSNPGVRWIEFADGSLPFFENFFFFNSDVEKGVSVTLGNNWKSVYFEQNNYTVLSTTSGRKRPL